MILSKRVQHSHTSYPMSSELAPCFSSSEHLASPPTTPPRSQKHTLSKPMMWLNRSSSSTSSLSAPHAAPKPTRISEPKALSSLEQFNFHRSGLLGSGATIVRTPQEALSGIRPTNEEDEDADEDAMLQDAEKNENRILPPLPPSPPLPPLPDVPDTDGEGRFSDNPASDSLSDHVLPPRLSSATSPAASRPTLLAHSRVSSRSTPVLSANTNDSIPPQLPFEAILLSPIPDSTINPFKTIVTLETCTTTYRTLLRTLLSRPSYLSRYITSLLSPVSETASVYSNSSDTPSAQHSIGFSSFFRDHLDPSDCLSQPCAGIHVFLDRPSAPYIHILAYLRSAPSAPGHPEMLPRAVHPGPMPIPPTRLEPLLELRDEARYLGLVELERLCSREIQRTTLPVCAGGTHHGQTGSVTSVHTIVEQSLSRRVGRPSELRVFRRNNSTATSATSSSGSSLENKDALIRERGRGLKHEVGSPPPGWI